MNAERSTKTPSTRTAGTQSATRTGAFATLACLLPAKGSGAPSAGPRGLARRLGLLAALTAAASLLAVGSAAAATVWNLEMHHNQTNFSTSVPGSIEVQMITNGSPTASEVQQLTVNAESGHFTLGFAGETTTELEYNAANGAVQSALRALPSIGGTNVKTKRQVTGSLLTFTVTFQEALADTDVPQVTAADGTPPLGLAAHAQYWFDLDNVGSSPSSGPIKLTVNLPAGLTRNSVIVGEDFIAGPPLTWSCPGSPGDTTVTCTTTAGQIPRHTLAHIILEVNVEPGLPEGIPLIAQATLEGGGAEKAAADSEPTEISSTAAGFGILAPSFVPDFFAADGTTVQREAGAHPDLLTVPVDFNSVPAPIEGHPTRKRESGSIRDLTVDLPPGFIGNPTAVGECTAAQYTVAACPASSQLGRFDGTLYNAAAGLYFNFTTGVFNMVHPRGAVTDLGFQVGGNPVHVRASLDPANRYAITTSLADINESLPPFSGKATIWGVPADSSHDSERCPQFSVNLGSGGTGEKCSAEHPVKPFVTMPSRCDTDNVFRLHEYDSWQNKGVFGPDIPYTLPGRLHGCDQIPFDPSVSVAPTTDTAESPSGLDVKISLPQHEECTPIVPAPPEEEPQYECEIATSPLRDATVALPAGIAVNPAGANGLEACTEAQISLGTDKPVACPEGSKVASVEVTTPALPDPVEGVVYLATPYQNPFGSLLAGYLVLEEPDRGILVKIPGKIAVDPATGQLTGTFEENPQLPFSKLELHFKAGAHSTLITPPTCGEYTAQADFTPWSGTADVKPASSFAISKAPGGGSCASSESALPNSPSLDAGTVTPLAAHYSPFTLDLSREDGTQRFSSVTISPPPGLTAKLAGTATCPDSALAAAEAKSGKEEQSSPSCPADSRIGTVYAAAGAGPSPYWAPGAAYLTGPYKGAPLSMAIVTPAVAGPFDLGTVVVRTALHVDPETARITAVSDPLPTSLKGIPLDIRRARVYLERPEFTLNGTSCDPLSVTGNLLSTLGQSAPLTQRFQLAECGRLAFKPKLAINLKGGTKRNQNPALSATVTYPKGAYSNIASASVALPHSEFLDQAHIRTICTRVQFAEGNVPGEKCPAGSIYGHARAITPLLDQPLEGPVYLRSSSHPLPDLVAALNGQIQVVLDGTIDSHKGGIRNRFEVVPDAPVSKFTLSMQGGKKGLLVNSTNLCKSTNKAVAKFVAQNGRTYDTEPVVTNSCKGGGKGKGHHHHKSHRVGTSHR